MLRAKHLLKNCLGWAKVPLGTLGTQATTKQILIYRLVAVGLRYPGLGTLGTQAAMEASPDLQAIGSWA